MSVRQFRVETADNGFILYSEAGPTVSDPLGTRGVSKRVFTDRVELLQAIDCLIEQPASMPTPWVEIAYATDKSAA